MKQINLHNNISVIRETSGQQVLKKVYHSILYKFNKMCRWKLNPLTESACNVIEHDIQVLHIKLITRRI